MTRRRAILLALPLLLAGCSHSAQEPKAGAAGGQVLPGTISDAMIDTSHSQALAPVQPYHRVAASGPDLPGDAATGAPDAAAPAAPPAEQ